MNKNTRLLTVDLLRGLFLCIIIVDHLARYPGFFEIFTGRGYLWVSAAEGFFFLSGWMIGMIRGRRNIEKKFNFILSKLFSRTLLLYSLTVVLTLTFTFIAYMNLGNEHLKSGLVSSGNVFDII